MLLSIQVDSQLSKIEVFKVERVFTVATVECVIVYATNHNASR